LVKFRPDRVHGEPALWFRRGPDDVEYAGVSGEQAKFSLSPRSAKIDSLCRMKSHSITFTGAVLERGFWLYAWHVSGNGKAIVYAGRTGDNSSPNASSPFARLGQHLDVRPKASANMLHRHLVKHGIDPIIATYQLVTVGPIYPEVPGKDMREHVKYRDVVNRMEQELADHLRAKGYQVVSNHPRSTHPLVPRYEEAIRLAEKELVKFPPPSRESVE
jgi:hypothetical protein